MIVLDLFNELPLYFVHDEENISILTSIVKNANHVDKVLVHQDASEDNLILEDGKVKIDNMMKQ